MKYRVHIYAVVRVPVEVEAESQQEAIKTARETCDLEALFTHPEFEYAEDTDGFLVDEVGDAEYEHSTWYDKHGEPEAMPTRFYGKPTAARGRTPLVVEFHYSDGDIGAYNDDIEAAYKLWREFAASNPELHKPTHILIRPE